MKKLSTIEKIQALTNASAEDIEDAFDGLPEDELQEILHQLQAEKKAKKAAQADYCIITKVPAPSTKRHCPATYNSFKNQY